MKIEFEEITISEVEQFHKQVMTYIKNFKDETLILDLEDLDKVDLCGMQVFLALEKYCNNLGINLEFKNIGSNSLEQSIKTYNLEKLFGMVS